MFNENTTCVTMLIDLQRNEWVSYKREFSWYLEWFKNTLSLKSNMVVHIDPRYYEFAISERKRHDPELKHTIFVETRLQDVPMYGYHGHIAEVMQREDFRNGLALPDVPEAINPDYAVVIMSKVPLMRRWADANPFNTPYFCWVDAGVCYSQFPQRLYGSRFPVDNKIADACSDNKIHILCRSSPQESDLDLHHFFKAHINRLAAVCVFGWKHLFSEFDRKQTELLERALSMNLIDCEQSLWAVIYLENRHLIHAYMGDWYDNFLRVAE